MDKVIDLNELLNRRIKVKLNNDVLNIKDVNILQFEKMVKIEESGTLEEQCKLIAEIVSNNDENIKISLNDIKNLTRPTVSYLWSMIATRSIDISTDPN